MLNQLLKFTLFSSLLLWLRPRWRGLLSLSFAVVLIHVFHGEYLGYVELSGNDQFLFASYLVKWTGLTAALIAYYFFSLAGLKVARSGEKKARAAAKNCHTKEGDKQGLASSGDGFDFLRDKKQLESEAEKLLSSHGKE